MPRRRRTTRAPWPDVGLSSQAAFVNQQARIEALAEIKKLEAEAQLKRQRSEAKKMLVSDDMVEWLGQHRLQECAADLARIAGAYAHDVKLVVVACV